LIFVTVGTDHHQFPRLLRAVDDIAGTGEVGDEFVVQYGMNNYVPRHCEAHDFLPFDSMKTYIDRARIVVTHGSSTALLALAADKSPIIVPRLKRLNEIIDDHQWQFAQCVKDIAPVLVVDDIRELDTTIQNYDELARERRARFGATGQEGSDTAVQMLHATIRRWFP